MKEAAAIHIDISEIRNDLLDSASADTERASRDSNNRMNAGSSSSVRGSIDDRNSSRIDSSSASCSRRASRSGLSNHRFPSLIYALPIAGFVFAVVCLLLSIIAVVLRRSDLALVVVILAAIDVLFMIGNVIAISVWCKKNLNESNPKQ